MDYPATILAVLGIAAGAGVLTAYYKKGSGEAQLKAAQNINDMLKDENALLIRKNTALLSQLDIANDVIEKLAKK